jgi:hypothetical protein
VSALAADMLEMKNFSHLAHRQSLGWHRAPLLWGSSLPSVEPSDHVAYPFRVAGLCRNHRLASIGMLEGSTGSRDADGSERPDAGRR